MSARHLDIELRVNRETVSARVEARQTLVDFLRDDLSLTGTHVGCEHGVCGACTVLLDGEVIRGCLVFAVQCDGAEVETIEGLSEAGTIADLQLAFQQRNALQCGYCTPGMLISANELLARGSVPSRDAIREHLSGNYCRCTGYQAIVDAIEAVAQARAEKGMTFIGADTAQVIFILPRARGGGERTRAGRRRYWLARSEPGSSTMLRTVPLPRCAGAEKKK